MPFWRKSEDPWDWKDGVSKPPREPREPKEPRENPIETVKAWNEDRKAKAKEKEEAKWLPPEKCPWCGKEMEQGFLLGGRDSVRWYPGVYKTDWLRGLDSANKIDVLDEGGIWSGLYKTVWLCRECKKAVFTMPDPPAYEDSFSALVDQYANNTQEEEESGD